MFDVAFNIDNLLAPCVTDKLSEYDSCAEKAQLLIALVDYDISALNGLLFGTAEIEEIEAFYEDKTGITYQPEFELMQDEKDFILEYADKINNYSKVKTLINDILTEREDGESEGEAISAAKRELSEIEEQEAKEEREKRDRIVVGELDVMLADGTTKHTTEKNTEETKKQKTIYANTILSRAKRAAALLAKRE